jgi:hypothetical protein
MCLCLCFCLSVTVTVCLPLAASFYSSLCLLSLWKKTLVQWRHAKSRGPRSGSPSSGSTSGGTDGPERAAEPTPLAGALAGARALPQCLLICHLGRRRGDPRKSDGKAAHSEQPGPDVSTTLRHGESPKDPAGRDLLTASSPAPTCRQHCDTERVRKIQWEGMCSQRAARAPSESSVRLAVRVDNIATRPGGSTVQVLTDYVCCAARYIRGYGKGACQRVLHSDLT